MPFMQLWTINGSTSNNQCCCSCFVLSIAAFECLGMIVTEDCLLKESQRSSRSMSTCCNCEIPTEGNFVHESICKVLLPLARFKYVFYTNHEEFSFRRN